MTLAETRRLHALGLSLIPLIPRTKKPDDDVLPRDEKGKAVWKPYQSARPSETELQTWFGNGVERNVGIPLGVVSGVVVIETDSPEAEAWARAHLPATPMATHSARGVHRYYRLPTSPDAHGVVIPPTITVADGVKIEIKRGGQYVVGPGSIHPSGHVYTEVEPWPASLASVPEFPMATILAITGATTTSRESAPPLPTVIELGSRNDLLFKEGCRLRRLGWDEVEICKALEVLNTERCHPALDSTEVATIARSCAKYDSAADSYPRTDTGNAEFFAATSGDLVRYDHGRRLWFVFNGHHWLTDQTGLVDRLALDAIRGRQAAALTLTDSDDRKKQLRWTIDSESRARRENLVRLAAKLQTLAVTGDDWDTNPWLLGVRNGVVDLQTGQRRDGRTDDHITKVAPVDFDPNARCPRWERFVREIFAGHPEVADYTQRVIGYALTGITTEQAFWILCGNGANGKSTLLEVLMHAVFGDAYAWTMPFPTTGWSNAMSEYQKASLVGQRLIQSVEVSLRCELNDELIKSLTGGDTINARHPFGRPFHYVPIAKIFLRVNDKPIIRDQSHGMWRRVKLILFEQTFPVNLTLGDELRAEAPGILAWAVRGCQVWQRDGLCHPAVVEAATEEYRGESDPLNEFIVERCLIADGLTVGAKAFFDSYAEWCGDRRVPDEQRLSQRGFGMQMRKRFRVEDKKTATYFGVGLQTAQPNADDGSRDTVIEM